MKAQSVILKNKTTQTQQVHYVDGTCATIKPGKEKRIDLKKVYASEIERWRSFFIVPDDGDGKKSEKKKERKVKKIQEDGMGSMSFPSNDEKNEVE